MVFKPGRGLGIKLRQLVQALPGSGDHFDEIGLRSTQRTEEFLAQGLDLGGILSRSALFLKFLFVELVKSGVGDFLGLKSEEVGLLGNALFVRDELGLVAFKRSNGIDDFGMGQSLLGDPSEGVEHPELRPRIEE